MILSEHVKAFKSPVEKKPRLFDQGRLCMVGHEQLHRPIRNPVCGTPKRKPVPSGTAPRPATSFFRAYPTAVCCDIGTSWAEKMAGVLDCGCPGIRVAFDFPHTVIFRPRRVNLADSVLGRSHRIVSPWKCTLDRLDEWNTP